MLSLKESLKLLRKYKIKIVKGVFSLSLRDLEKNFKGYGKAVLKVYSPDIIHKTEAKLVALNISSKKELKEAYKSLLHKTFRYNKNARIESFILQKQVEGLELIVGGKIDEVFGKVIVFGSGGIFTEVYKDIAIRALPIDIKEAEEMVKETRVYTILKGYRGRSYNLKSLFELIVRSGKMFLNEDIKELDFNPVIINEEDAYIVDWRIIA